MKTLSQFLKFFFSFTCFILLMSCAKEGALFPNKEARMQNNGYLPLAPNNTWVYENSLGTIQPDGKFLISGDSFKTEHTIAQVDQIYSNNTNENRFNYGFSPINLSKTINGFLGNLNQIVKVGNEYKKKSIIRFEKLEDGKIVTDLKYELDNQIFLTDKELPKNSIISVNNGKIGKPDQSGVYIEYSTTTYFKNKLAAMPDSLMNSEDERQFFSNFKDIIHTRDEVRIKKLVNKNAGGMKLTGTLKVSIPEGKMAGSMYVPDADIKGNVNLRVAVILFNAPFAAITGKNGRLIMADLTSDLDVCESVGTSTLDDVSESSSIELISDQVLYIRDNYWVKGIGNVKNITTPAIINAKVESISVDTGEVKEPFVIKPVDENCTNQINTVKFRFELTGKSSNISVTYPITLDTRSYIQTLRKYSIRKSLN